MSERRRHARLRLELDVDVGSGHEFYAARSRDLSEGGLFIATDVAIPMGKQIDVAFTIAERRVEVTVEVMWALDNADGTPQGVGVKFLDLFPEERDAILAFMHVNEPMLFGTDPATEEARPPGPAPKRAARPPGRAPRPKKPGSR